MGEEVRRLPERAGCGTVLGNLVYLFGLLATLKERSAPLMSMSSDPELAGDFGARLADNALELGQAVALQRSGIVMRQARWPSCRPLQRRTAAS